MPWAKSATQPYGIQIGIFFYGSFSLCTDLIRHVRCWKTYIVAYFKCCSCPFDNPRKEPNRRTPYDLTIAWSGFDSYPSARIVRIWLRISEDINVILEATSLLLNPNKTERWPILKTCQYLLKLMITIMGVEMAKKVVPTEVPCSGRLVGTGGKGMYVAVVVELKAAAAVAKTAESFILRR